MKIAKWDVIKLNLFKQHLYHTNELSSKKDLPHLLRSLGCVQLDTLNVVTRSQNLVFWSRIADYKENDFLLLYNEKLAFECYVHALSLMPLEEYPYWQNSLTAFRTGMMEDTEKWKFLLEIHHFIQFNSPATTRMISNHYNQAPSKSIHQWEMSPVRWALDRLWRSGLIQVTRDFNFQKIFQTSEGIIPEDLLKKTVTEHEKHDHYTIKALNAMGAATDKDIADYFRLPLRNVKQSLKHLLDKGCIQTVKVEEIQNEYFILTEDLELMNSGNLKESPDHCTFLSPFDNLIWFRPRVMSLFGVDYRLESYVPQHQRKYGYFALPILIRGKIIGTIDLKHERKEKRLLVKHLYFYPSFERKSYQKEIHFILENLARFLHVQDIVTQ